MSAFVYVGNLGRDTTEDAVRAAFETGGRAVKNVVIMRTPRNERSRGFGFVELDSADEASAAITALNGVEVDGRPLRVSEARERPPERNYGRSFDSPRPRRSKKPRSRSR